MTSETEHAQQKSSLGSSSSSASLPSSLAAPPTGLNVLSMRSILVNFSGERRQTTARNGLALARYDQRLTTHTKDLINYGPDAAAETPYRLRLQSRYSSKEGLDSNASISPRSCSKFRIGPHNNEDSMGDPSRTILPRERLLARSTSDLTEVKHKHATVCACAPRPYGPTSCANCGLPSSLSKSTSDLGLYTYLPPVSPKQTRNQRTSKQEKSTPTKHKPKTVTYLNSGCTTKAMYERSYSLQDFTPKTLKPVSLDYCEGVKAVYHQKWYDRMVSNTELLQKGQYDSFARKKKKRC